MKKIVPLFLLLFIANNLFAQEPCNDEQIEKNFDFNALKAMLDK